MSGLVLLLVFAARLVGCSSCVDLGCCDVSGGDPPTTINCTTAGHLRGISTALPARLKVLVLEYQIIRVIKRLDLPYLPELRLLAIKNSRLAAVHAGSFESVPNVTTLDLSANKIRTLEAGAFAGLQKLRTLNLAVNSIYSVDNGTFAELRELRTLDLSGNCLPRIPGDVWLLQSATEVNLVFNLILRAPLEDLQNFERATEGMTLDGAGEHGNCDCTLREIRNLIKRNKRLRWSIWCTDANGQLKYLSTIPLDSLTCEPPEVSVTPATQVVGAQRTASFTCRAVCKEQLRFSWLLPNGEEHPSSYEHSRQYTNARVQQCKGFNVRAYKKLTVCYSVFTVTSSSANGDGSDVSGTYTCRVTGDHTHNASASAVLTMRHTQDWTTPQQHTTAIPNNPIEGQDTNATTPDNKSTVLVSEMTPRKSAERPVSVSVYVVVASVIVVCVTLVVVTAVRKVRTRKEKREKNDQTRDVNQTPNNEEDTRTYENDNQFFNEGDPGNRVVYENDNQFSSEETLGRQTYENNDQFSNEEAEEQKPYENDDQFSNEETFGRTTYENDDQFPNEEAKKQPYENDDQFSNEETFGRTTYENDDQFPNEETKEQPYENDDQFFDDEETGHIYDNNDELSGRDRITSRQKKRARGADEARPSHQPRRINRRKLRPSMCKITVQHEDIEERHYDNRTPGSCRVTTRSVGSHTGTKVLQHATSQVISFYDNEKPTNNIRGTAVFVATEASEAGFGHYDNEVQNRNGITTRSKNTSQTNESDYVTRSCIIAAKRKARESAGAKLCNNVAFTASHAHPMGHYDNQGNFIRFAESSQRCATDKQQSKSRTGCHVRREDSGIRVQKDEQSGDAIETTSANDYIVVKSGEPSEPADYLDIQKTDQNKTNDTSEHDYVTLPNTGDKIDDDTSEHEYVTLPGTDKIDDDTSDHEYVTLPSTNNKPDDTSEHAYVTFPTHNNTDDISDHEYVTLPNIGDKTDDQFTDHEYVTFPNSS